MISPALTCAPSATSSAPTVPPLRCWTFFTLDCTTSEPEATMAPASLVVAPSVPIPNTRTSALAPIPTR